MSAVSASVNGGPQGRRFRRTRRILKWVLAIVAVLYLIGYALGFAALKRVADEFARTQFAATGEVFHAGVGVWPFGLSLRADEINFGKIEENGVSALRDVVITLPLFTPWQIVTQLDAATYENANLKFATGDITTRLIWTPNSLAYKSHLQDVSIWAGMAAVAADTPLQIKDLTLDYLRRLVMHDQTAPEEEVSFSAAPLTLPLAAMLKTKAPDVTVPQIDKIAFRITAEPALPRDMRNRDLIAAWQQAGGELTLSPVTVDLMGLNASLNGPVTLSPDLVPQGTLTLTLVGIDKAYANLGTYNNTFRFIDPQQYQSLGMVLKMGPQGGAGPINLSLKVADRMLSFANAPFFQIGQLPWDIVPAIVPTPGADLPAQETPKN